MNKFTGTFNKIDINKIKPNDWNPKEKKEDNLENELRYQQIKTNIANKSLYFPIIVRSLGDVYEIVDGYHRWLACKELGYTEIMIWDLGEIKKEEAQGITLDSIYLNISPSEPMTAQIVKAIQLTNPEAIKLLPFNELQIQEYLQLAEFSWEDYLMNINNSEGEENVEVTEIKGVQNIKIRLNKESFNNMKEYIEKVSKKLFINNLLSILK